LNKEPLPPLPNEVFDGEKFSVELKENKCPHKDIKLIDNVIRCKCGAAWSGPQIGRLYEALKKQ
jgi:hypothetical protein